MPNLQERADEESAAVSRPNGVAVGNSIRTRDEQVSGIALHVKWRIHPQVSP